MTTKLPPIDKRLTPEETEELFQRILADETVLRPLREWQLWGARHRVAAKAQGLFWDDENVVFNEPEPKPHWINIYKSVLREKFGDDAQRYLDVPLRVKVANHLRNELGIED